MISVKIDGLKDIHENLKQFPARIEKGAVQQSTYQGILPILLKTKAMTPVGKQATGGKYPHQPGNLRNSFKIEKMKSRIKGRGGWLMYIFAPRTSKQIAKSGGNVGGWYWRFVEFDRMSRPSVKELSARKFMKKWFKKDMRGEGQHIVKGKEFIKKAIAIMQPVAMKSVEAAYKLYSDSIIKRYAGKTFRSKA